MPCEIHRLRIVLLVSGSLRPGSTNTAVLRTARAVAPAGIEAVLYERMADLPHFDPDADREPLPEPVVHLRGQLRAADAVLFSTPEYAGNLPGSFKNLLDWTVGDGLYGKPVGWINASAAGGAQGAYAALRSVLGYVNAQVVADACAEIPVRRDGIGADGTVADPSLRDAIGRTLSALRSTRATEPARRRSPW